MTKEQEIKDDEEIMDKKDAIKTLVTRLEEITDQLSTLREEAADLKKEYAKKYDINMKMVVAAMGAVRKELDGDELSKTMEAIEPIIRH
jgi:uncharacterized coiled-coil DUF342 family protein